MDKFTHPVFRSGVVLANKGVRSLGFDEASQIGRFFEQKSVLDAYKDLRSKSFRHLDELGLKCSWEWLRVDHTPKIVYNLTPIISLPPVSFTLKGHVWLFREAFTVCFGDSNSKLWAAASRYLKPKSRPKALSVIDAYAKETILELQSYWRKVFDITQASFIPFYQDLLNRSISEHRAPKVRSRSSKSLTLEIARNIHITSLGTMDRLSEQIDQLSHLGKSRYLRRINSSRSSRYDTVKSFLEMISRGRSGSELKDYSKVPMFIASSLPRSKEIDKNDSKTNILDRQPRRSLVTARVEKASRLETYYTIGSEDTRFLTTKGPEFLNSELTARSIVFEIGRVF